VTTFFGLRYAQPPTGELRWQPPQEIEYKNNYDPSTVIDATNTGPICVQVTPYWNITNTSATLPSLNPGSEDCLLADVLVPQAPVNSRLPVMVGRDWVDGRGCLLML